MVKPKKVIATARGKEEEPSNGGLMVQSRSRRTIKPNPKYNSQEIIPLKRIEGEEEDDDDDENEASRNTEEDEDEDFRDDGAKDSDLEDTPPKKQRGRPKAAEAPRSEPQRRLINQIRQDFRDTARSTSKILQQSSLGAAGLLDKKRKLDYDASEGESDEPNAKRRSGPNAATAATTRPSPGANTTSTSGKENTGSVLKKSNADVKLVNISQILNKPTSPVKSSPTSTPGITTRRQQAATPPVTAPSSISTGIVRSAITIANSSGKDASGRLPVQVRRQAPVVTTPPAAKTVSVPQKSPAPEKQVILNRTPVVKPKPATPNAIVPTAATRIVANRAVTIKGSPSPVANRILNSAASPAIVKPYLVPAGAQLEPLPEGKTRVTTFENRFVVRVSVEDETEEVARDDGRQPISLIKLRSEIKSLKMPTALWSYQMKLHARRGEPDPRTDVPDKPGYMVHSIMLNRLVQTSPKTLNGQTVDTRQYDRTLELLKDHYKVTIDGRPVKLVGAPKTVADKAEVETLMQIVNHVTIDSPVVKTD